MKKFIKGITSWPVFAAFQIIASVVLVLSIVKLGILPPLYLGGLCGGLGGVENSVKTIEDFMGIDINYYVRVNFTSLVKIVDALGGITVESPAIIT